MKFYFFNDKFFKFSPVKFSRAGQTIIETMVAVLIMVMGIAAAISLAIYAYSGTSNTTKQIVAIGLAREGLEAVRNMRDTNWLRDTLVVNGCWDFAASQNNKANCYANWIGDYHGNIVPYCLNPTGGGQCHGDDNSDSYNLGINTASDAAWVFTQSTNYGMNFNDPANSAVWLTSGFYSPSNSQCVDGSGKSNFCREIILSKLQNGPFDPDNSGGDGQTPGPLLLVRSRVWWVDKKCQRALSYNSANVACRVELDTYLTNWKNFQP